MDDFNNLIDTGRFLRVMADIETGKDEPEPHQFKRDQHLTPAALFKAKVLALLHSDLRAAESMQASDYAGGACAALRAAIVRVDGVQP